MMLAMAWFLINSPLIASEPIAKAPTQESNDTYTIHFNNVPLIELIRFASKITGLNFVFEEGDLQFFVTIVSEEAMTSKNLIAALSQVLRTRDLVLLEQDGNVLITKSKQVNQIPPIVSADLTDSDASHAALVTRVFRIKNASAASIAAILRPMISQGALIEVSAETRQLIVTDIAANVEQIASLLTSLDSPHSPLDVEPYTVKNISPQDLITLTQQILSPFTEGNPLTFVPQESTNTVFIISTPHLIEKAMTVMEDLDMPSKSFLIRKSGIAGKDVFIYKPIYFSPEELLEKLSQIAAQMKSSASAPSALEIAIESASELKDTNSVMFIAGPETTAQLSDILASLDTGAALGKSAFWVYTPVYRPGIELQSELSDLGQNLKQSGLADRSLLASLESMKWIPSINSLLFTGDPQSTDKIQTMLKSVDTPNTYLKSSQVFIYRPAHISPDQIQSVLQSLIPELQNSHTLFDDNLIQAIKDMQWNPESGSFIAIADPASIDRLKDLFAAMDTPQSAQTLLSKGFFLYKLQRAQCDAVLSELHNIAKRMPPSSLQNKNLVSSINRITCIPSQNALLITGTGDVIEKLKALIAEFDGGAGGKGGSAAMMGRTAETFLLYNPKYVSGEELIAILCDFKQNLVSSGISDPDLFETIDHLKWIEKTSSLLISGDQPSIDKVLQLVHKFDVPGRESSLPFIESIDNTSFLVYKLKFHSGKAIQTALKQLADKLSRGADCPASFISAVDSLQWIQVTNSLLCSGPQDVLIRLKELIQDIDIPLRQVFIEVLVIETSLINQQNFGLMWGGQVQYFNKTVLQTGNFPTTTANGSQTPTNTFMPTLQGINATTTPNGGSIPFSTGFDLGVIGDIIMHKGKSFVSLGSLLNAIQLDTDTTILLNPKIITQDNRQSTVFVGQNFPYTSSLITNNSGTASVGTNSTQNVEYRDVGVSLTITPILGDGDIVTMDIVQDISVAPNGSNATTRPIQVNGILTNNAHMETRVHVPNNHFVALSGMINDTKTHFRTSIPCLGALPVIGALFSENDRIAQKGNVIIFIRPQIIHSFEEYKAITEHQEWLYKDSARIPVLKDEFDEGLDMVKLPEN